MNNVWFTSDTHFDHPNVAKVHRGFESVQEHDRTLIDRWNAVVQTNDVVWHLGDVGRGSTGVEHQENVLGCVEQLNGVIHLIAGNHDPVHPLNRDSHRHLGRWLRTFASVQPFARRRVDDGDVLLSHFSYSGDHTAEDRHTQYRLRDEGLPLLHGHLHGLRIVSPPGQTRQVNVGVDVWDFAPVHLDQLVPLLK